MDDESTRLQGTQALVPCDELDRINADFVELIRAECALCNGRAGVCLVQRLREVSHEQADASALDRWVEETFNRPGPKGTH